MRKLALALTAALLLPALGLAQGPGLDALKARFSPQEQILLSGLLADPRNAQEFVQDGAGDQTAFQVKWRARLFDYCSGYLSRPHPLNEHAPSLKQAVSPDQWAMLMATLRALHNSGSWTDQAKLKIFLGMIDDADSGLKSGDPSGARRVANTADPKLADAMHEYLGSAAARDAVAKEKALEQAARDQAAREQAARDQAAKDQAAKDQAAKDKAAKDQAAKDKAARDRAAHQRAAAPVAPAAPAAPRPGQRTAQEQLDAANRAAQGAAGKSPEQAAADAGRVLDGGTSRGSLPGDPPPVAVTPSGSAGGAAPLPTGLLKPGPVPSLTVDPNVPSPSVGQDDDMAELHKMEKQTLKKGRWRKWEAAGIGAVLGGLIGFFLGGPIGAAVGAAVLGGAGFALSKHLWG